MIFLSKNTRSMTILSTEYFNHHGIDYTQYSNFIETGTCYGDTIFAMEPFFEKLYTIEIQKHLYTAIKEKYTREKIEFLLGDSALILKDLLEKVVGKSILYLDGHWSGDETGMGIKACPLYEELEAIRLYHKEEAIIIIDDTSMFGSNYHPDWQTMSFDRIKEPMLERGISIRYLPDGSLMDHRLLIHIGKRND